MAMDKGLKRKLLSGAVITVIATLSILTAVIPPLDPVEAKVSHTQQVVC